MIAHDVGCHARDVGAMPSQNCVLKLVFMSLCFFGRSELRRTWKEGVTRGSRNQISADRIWYPELRYPYMNGYLLSDLRLPPGCSDERVPFSTKTRDTVVSVCTAVPDVFPPTATCSGATWRMAPTRRRSAVYIPE